MKVSLTTQTLKAHVSLHPTGGTCFRNCKATDARHTNSGPSPQVAVIRKALQGPRFDASNGRI